MFGLGKRKDFSKLERDRDHYDKKGYWRTKSIMISVTATVLNETIVYQFRREVSIVGLYGRTNTGVAVWFDDADQFTNYSLPASLPFEVLSVSYTPANYSTFDQGNYVLVDAGVYLHFDSEPIRTRQLFVRPPNTNNFAVQVFFI